MGFPASCICFGRYLEGISNCNQKRCLTKEHPFTQFSWSKIQLKTLDGLQKSTLNFEWNIDVSTVFCKWWEKWSNMSKNDIMCYHYVPHLFSLANHFTLNPAFIVVQHHHSVTSLGGCFSTFGSFHPLVIPIKAFFSVHTVDGRNPAPLGMYKTL